MMQAAVLSATIKFKLLIVVIYFIIHIELSYTTPLLGAIVQSISRMIFFCRWKGSCLPLPQVTKWASLPSPPAPLRLYRSWRPCLRRTPRDVGIHWTYSVDSCYPFLSWLDSVVKCHWIHIPTFDTLLNATELSHIHFCRLLSVIKSLMAGIGARCWWLEQVLECLTEEWSVSEYEMPDL